MKMASKVTVKTEAEFDVSLTFPNDEGCDVVFIVEGKKMFLSKAILSVISPVFRRMFQSEFKEKESKEIPLPDKTASEMEEFLGVIYPTVMKPLEDCDIFQLLKLADEYQVDSIKKRCTEFLTRKCNTKGEEIPMKDLLQMLLAADSYDLRELADVVLPLTHKASFSDVEKISFFQEMSDKMKSEVMKIRLKTLEPIYEGGHLAKHLKRLVPCTSKHGTGCFNHKCSCSTQWSCMNIHDYSKAFAALDFLLCHYLRCTSLDVATIVTWLKFAKASNCPNALRVLKISKTSPEFYEILKHV